MGTQQLLLIVLGVIIVGIAVVVGINIFGSNAEQANKDAVTQDCLRVAAAAQGFFRKPEMLGGGEGDFTNIEITDCGMTADDGETMVSTNINGVYTLSGNADADLTITGNPLDGTGAADVERAVVITLDMAGATDADRVSTAYTGW
ncbi:MAG: hypothetical protein IH600_12180 [Bacteroidetes bacterium]|nr:hypothetical protein [Bacteroidota bacterium]